MWTSPTSFWGIVVIALLFVLFVKMGITHSSDDWDTALAAQLQQCGKFPGGFHVTSVA
jgi:hypothetical protein